MVTNPDDLECFALLASKESFYHHAADAALIFTATARGDCTPSTPPHFALLAFDASS